MEIVLWLLIGAVAGLLAVFAIYRTIPRTAWQWVSAIIVGIIGGWLGGFLANVLGLEAVNWLGALVVAFAGAVLILLLFRSMAPHA